MPVPKGPFFWQKDAAISMTWESVGVMLSIAITVVGLAIAYFRTFVRGELLEAKDKITERFKVDLREVVEMHVERIDRRVEKVEEKIDQQIERVEEQLDERDDRRPRRG